MATADWPENYVNMWVSEEGALPPPSCIKFAKALLGNPAEDQMESKWEKFDSIWHWVLTRKADA